MWMIDMSAWYILPIVIGAILLFYLLLLFPRARKPKNETLLHSYAHRGLHNSEVPENSLEAFSRATNAGYGIELDVQLSSDGVVVVFHDNTLTRMCGVDKKVSECTLEELKTYRLLGSEEQIPTLSEVLSLVNGRIPLLIEMKGESANASLVEPLAELLKGYDGPYCIESFNPYLLFVMRKQLPEAYYGLLYTNVCREKGCSFLNMLVTLMALNIVAKPNFISYDKRFRHSPLVWFTTKVFPPDLFLHSSGKTNPFSNLLYSAKTPFS